MRSFVTALVLFSLNAQVYASEDLGFGVENFHWSEYDAAGTLLLEESGQRQFLAYRKVDYDAAGISTLSGRFYFGDVFYDGQLMDGTPYSSTTGYTGFSVEQSRQYPRLVGEVHGELGLGMEWWRRILDKDGTYGYTEHYLTLYVRAGLGVGRSGSGWYGNAGLKYPVAVNETVSGIRDMTYIYDNIHLNPAPASSIFAQLGYAYPSWDWALYYDGYHFQQSPPSEATSGGLATGNFFVQPESVMERIGVRFSSRF
jgi:hypothetical protein